MPQNSTTTCAAPDASGTVQCVTEYNGSLYAGGFTYGEIVNSVFLFILLMTAMTVCFHLMFRKVKIKN